MTDTLQPISRGSFAFMTDTSQERGVVIGSSLGTGGCWRVLLWSARDLLLSKHHRLRGRNSSTPRERQRQPIERNSWGWCVSVQSSFVVISFHPLRGTCLKVVTTGFTTCSLKKIIIINLGYVLVLLTFPSENIKNAKSAMSHSAQIQALLLTRNSSFPGR